MVGLIEASSGVYGPLLLGLLLLIGAAGVPLPGTALLLVAGALIREGVLDWPATLALAGAVLGDSVGYFVGRYGRLLALQHPGLYHPWGRALDVLDRWGGAAVLLTRFLITPSPRRRTSSPRAVASPTGASWHTTCRARLCGSDSTWASATRSGTPGGR